MAQTPTTFPIDNPKTISNVKIREVRIDPDTSMTEFHYDILADDGSRVDSGILTENYSAWPRLQNVLDDIITKGTKGIKDQAKGKWGKKA